MAFSGISKLIGEDCISGSCDAIGIYSFLVLKHTFPCNVMCVNLAGYCAVMAFHCTSHEESNLSCVLGFNRNNIISPLLKDDFDEQPSKFYDRAAG